MASELDKILIFHYLGAAQLAIYAIATAPVDQIRSTFLKLKDLAFPKLSQQTTTEIQKTLPAKIYKVALITLPIMLVYYIACPWIFHFFFPTYQESVHYSQLFVLTVFFTPFGIFSISLSAKKQIRSQYQLRVWGGIGRLGIYFVAIKYFGLIGLVWGEIIIELYMAILYTFFFKRMKPD